MEQTFTSTGVVMGKNVRDERGAVLYMVALMSVVFLGIAGLAIHLGIWFVGRSEAQRAAEAGAHAGAGYLMLAPGDEPGARAEAETFAETNVVRAVTPDVFPVQDIDVILDSQKVRVRVQRSEARGNPLRTLFARVMGINTVDIGAVAAAQVWPGEGTDCVLPFAIPDQWMHWDPVLAGFRPSKFGDMWDGPEVGGPDYYDPGPAPNGTGYSAQVIGQVMQLTSATPSATAQTGWHQSIRLPGSKGGNDFRASIRDCWEPAGEYQWGDPIFKEPGNMIGPTAQGFRDIFTDPDEQNMEWYGASGCMVTQYGECVGHESRRIRPIVMFDPRDWPLISQGMSGVPVANVAGMFLESWDGNNTVMARWMTYTAVQPATNWSDASGSLLRILRIVE